VSNAAKVRDEWCDEYTKARDLLLACRLAMTVSQQRSGGTDWKHMIKAIDKLTGYVPTSEAKP
jgi:hypothetical protein